MTTWTCRRPNCGADNVGASTYCTTCHAPAPGRAPLTTERRIPPVDLEDFLTRHFARGAKRHRAVVDIIDDRVFLTLNPDPPGDPAIYCIDDNAITPCDNFGRPSW